jgi:hypothetical protein
LRVNIFISVVRTRWILTIWPFSRPPPHARERKPSSGQIIIERSHYEVRGIKTSLLCKHTRPSKTEQAKADCVRHFQAFLKRPNHASPVNTVRLLVASVVQPSPRNASCAQSRLIGAVVNTTRHLLIVRKTGGVLSRPSSRRFRKFCSILQIVASFSDSYCGTSRVCESYFDLSLLRVVQCRDLMSLVVALARVSVCGYQSVGYGISLESLDMDLDHCDVVCYSCLRLFGSGETPLSWGTCVVCGQPSGRRQ